MEIHGVSTWYDRQHGIVRVTDDVANVVRDIHEISPRIHVYFNEQTETFDLVESCLDGTDRLIFSASSLDARVPNRLRAADQWRGREDPSHPLAEEDDFITDMDRANASLEAELKENQRDRLMDVGERLAWAGEMDRRGVGAQILVPRSTRGDDS